MKQNTQPIAQSLGGMALEWSAPRPRVSTGLAELDEALCGGLRSGDLLALVGAAKAGKSTLWGQVLYDAAKHGAIAIYASVEMPPVEVVSRWLARDIHLADPHARYTITTSDVLYGHAFRGEDSSGEPLASIEQADANKARLIAAIGALEQGEVGSRLFVSQLEPGASYEALEELVAGCRAQVEDAGKRVTVLLVDPVQRLWAAPTDQCKDASLARVNADEKSRIDLVMPQLKSLVDRENLCVLVTSDTTKRGSEEGVPDMRGSYMINHIATGLFGLCVTGSGGTVARCELSSTGLRRGSCDGFDLDFYREVAEFAEPALAVPPAEKVSRPSWREDFSD